MDVSSWLRELGLENYAQAFRGNDIDAEVLPRLTAEDLTAIGVTSVGHRRKLLEAIAALRKGTAPASAHLRARAVPKPAEAERRQLTVLFCDLVGSTELSAQLDAEELREVIGAYQACVAAVVRRWEGHLAKYMGDGALAYFGWPRAHEDDAERAVRVGLELVEAVGGLPVGAEVRLQARVGIATGQVVVGDLIGQDTADRDSVVGEVPNVAARLQALAEPGAVVIGEATRRLVGGLFELDDLGPTRLKGFAEPLAVWRVAGEIRTEGRFEARHAAGLTPLVGRDEELSVLLRRWEQAKDGEGQVVLLSGEPGIGKSRLVREVRGRLEGEPHLRLTYQCSPHHTTSPLHPLIEQLERAAAFERDDSAAEKLAKLETLMAQGTDKLDKAVPLVAAVLGIPARDRYPLPELTSQRQKQLTLEALVDQLDGLATGEPVLLVYEDVHWIDPTTQELLGLAIERIQRLSVLLLITFRPEFVPPWTGQPHLSALPLTRLGRRDGAAMVDRVVGAKPLPAEVSAQIVGKTDGVPLFVEELTKTVLESGLLRDAGNRYELASALPPLAIPATLHDSLLARLDRLASVKEIAQIGAAIGREFSHALLAAVADRPKTELQAALDQLVASELIFRRGAPPEATYSFKHALVQDAAYQSLLKSRRQQLHARIAQLLEDRFPEQPAAEPQILAYHLTEAGLFTKAVPQWLAAGEQALRRSAYSEAASRLARGLDLVNQLPPSPTRAYAEHQLQIVMGQALLPMRGPTAEVEAAFERARQLGAQVNQPRERFRASWGLWFCHYLRMNIPAMRALSEELLASLQTETDTELVLQAHHATWSSSWPQGLLCEAHRHAEVGLRIYEPERHHAATSFFGGHDAGVCCRQVLGMTRLLMGYPDQAVKAVEGAVDLARSLKHPFTLAIALGFASVVHQLRGDALRVRELTQAEIDLCTEQSIPGYLALGRILDGWARQVLDQSLDVEPEVRSGLEILNRLGSYLRRPYYLGLYAENRLCHAQLTEGLAIIDEAMAFAETGGERWYQAELYRLKGAVLLDQDRANRPMAEADFARAIATAREQRASWLELRAATSIARLWAEQGESQRAYDLLAPVYGWFTEGFETQDLRDAKALLDELS